ncbi:MAG: DUF1385 domain-containing protein [Synergistaceae bacterium]|jgi:uncharacterized protein YqhQ|nr:DUF1385 domain-containing protein [Synergistaceae bacterium]
MHKIWMTPMTALGLWARNAENLDIRKIPVGGQAVIEGVLMKGPDLWGLAVRQPDGRIFKDRWGSSSRTKSYPWKLPFLRGVVTMVEMMGTGFRALGKSAEVALGDSEEELTKKDLCVAIVVGIAAVVGLFIALPLWLSEVTTNFFSLSAGARNALEGVTRGVIFVAYVAVIGLWKDIEQVFRYHGAEHKTINAFEDMVFEEMALEGMAFKDMASEGTDLENALTPRIIAAKSRIHPRCGTSFLLIAILIGIAVFSVVGGGGILWRIGSRVALLPLVVGISYEIIRLASKSGFVGRLLMAPVLSLQYLTTREPDLGQIEIALASLNVALRREE